MTTSMDMQTAAEILGTGPRLLMAFLREHGVLHTSGPMKNTPKGWYIRKGYLDCELVKYQTGPVRHLHNKPKITGRGLALIQDMMLQHGMDTKESALHGKQHRTPGQQVNDSGRREVLRLAGVEKNG